ncbi:hypothetical protein [Haloarchaeobius sp. HRN-SO-5]|uniref:hypothetical protein n=1 Tax=Haloarchaeobius sp. HRN-SO-5 TaxID=3446118 RepID=UPI003EC00141
MTDDRDAFVRMAREFPVRTGLFTFGLPLFGVFQLVNVFLHGGSLPVIAAFALVLVAYSVALTRYHVAAYRRDYVTRRWPKTE